MFKLHRYVEYYENKITGLQTLRSGFEIANLESYNPSAASGSDCRVNPTAIVTNGEDLKRKALKAAPIFYL